MPPMHELKLSQAAIAFTLKGEALETSLSLRPIQSLPNK